MEVSAPIGIATLPVGAYTIRLDTTSYFDLQELFSAADTVTVEVITTAQAAQRLAALVNSTIAHPRPLAASLEAAAGAVERGDFVAGLNQLRAFQNQVRAQVAPANPALAESFIGAAQDVIDALSK